MSTTSQPVVWQKCTTTYVATRPSLDFPFKEHADIFKPESTTLYLGDDCPIASVFLWCYLERKLTGTMWSFNTTSRSDSRVRAMPEALQRLSKWFRHRAHRPRSVQRCLTHVGRFLAWADSPENSGQYEEVLGDPEIALLALKGYHTYLRSRLQNHQVTARTVGTQDQDAIACMSEIHGRVYKDHIEPISTGNGGPGTKAPEAVSVQQFATTLQAIFDSAVDLFFGAARIDPLAPPNASRQLRSSALDDSALVELRESYSAARILELACVAFAGLVFVDSGANLAVLKEYEEPDDLEEQLSKPDRINLTQKAVKFRAGGAEVEVHLTATTMTRLRDYLRVRHALVTTLDVEDIAPLFIQCTYPESGPRQPVGISPLKGSFLNVLRRKLKTVRVTLPEVNLRELRAYKQQEVLKRAPIEVAAKIMAHSVRTAIRAYSKSQESVRQAELAQFLGSLEKTVLAPSDCLESASQNSPTPVGACSDHGNPKPAVTETPVQPDCKKVQGCFFCDNYRVHADANDLHKLFSCRKVLQYIVPTHSDSIRAERVYTAVIDRIDQVLNELRRRDPGAYEAAFIDVDERGQLTRYWANKLQQLHLLGMLPSM